MMGDLEGVPPQGDLIPAAPGASATEDPVLLMCAKLDALIDLIRTHRPDLVPAKPLRIDESVCLNCWTVRPLLGVNCGACWEYYKEWSKTIRLEPPKAAGPRPGAETEILPRDEQSESAKEITLTSDLETALENLLPNCQPPTEGTV